MAEIGQRYFAVLFSLWRAEAPREGCLASARRSAFFRRLARFLKLSLPLLCPINVNFRPVVVPWQRDETAAGVCAVVAAAPFDSVPARPYPKLS